MKLLPIFTLLALSVSGLQAQSVYTSKNINIHFFSEAPLENIEASTKNGTSVLNAVKNELIIMVPIKSFTFDKSLMQEHFNENYMESSKYPNAIFKGSINEPIDYKNDGVYKINATGKLNVHGVDRERTVTGLLSIKDGIISIKADFIIICKDHGIKIPDLLIEKIAEEVNVNVNGSYIPYIKAEKNK